MDTHTLPRTNIQRKHRLKGGDFLRYRIGLGGSYLRAICFSFMLGLAGTNHNKVSISIKKNVGKKTCKWLLSKIQDDGINYKIYKKSIVMSFDTSKVNTTKAFFYFQLFRMLQNEPHRIALTRILWHRAIRLGIKIDFIKLITLVPYLFIREFFTNGHSYYSSVLWGVNPCTWEEAVNKVNQIEGGKVIKKYNSIPISKILNLERSAINLFRKSNVIPTTAYPFVFNQEVVDLLVKIGDEV